MGTDYVPEKNSYGLYELLLEEHRHAGDFRLRLLRGWGLSMGALAVVFAWGHEKLPNVLPLVPAAALLVTLVTWAADCRNRIAIRAARAAGSSFERVTRAGARSFFRRLHDPR